jgi:hydrogenase maturation protein HypF
MVAQPEDAGHYKVAWQPSDSIVIPTAPIIQGVVADLQRGHGAALISRKFHTTLVRLFTDLCDFLRRQTALNQVVMSGGAFQNAILLEELSYALASMGFAVYTHRLVPPNDGGIALGQAVAAGAMLGGGS